MKNFKGDFEELKQKISMAGFTGEWLDNNNMKRFNSKSGAILNWYPSTGTLQCQGNPEDSKKLQNALQHYSEITVNSTPVIDIKKRVFVAYGHDLIALEQLELILHKLDLEPFILGKTGGSGLTLIDELEKEVRSQNKTHFGIVLLTPDDMGYSKKDGSSEIKSRARQNVVLEMGMLLIGLGKENVAILQKGLVELPSDIKGIHYLGFNDHVREALPKLVDRLQKAGFCMAPDRIQKAYQ